MGYPVPWVKGVLPSVSLSLTSPGALCLSLTFLSCNFIVSFLPFPPSADIYLLPDFLYFHGS